MNFTGAVNKIKKHYAQFGPVPSIMITGEMNGEFAEVIIGGQQRWVLMNGRKALVLRTNV